MLNTKLVNQYLVAGAFCTLAACQRSADTKTAESSDLISREDPGVTPQPMPPISGRYTAEIIARRYLLNPDVTFWSYAVGQTSLGCTATMIGPRIAMTAAHCGKASQTITFYSYPNGDATARPVTETTGTCEWLVQAFDCSPPCSPASYYGDTLFAICPPLANGMYPGDKYGYMYFDQSPPPTATDVPTLYSIWQNPVQNIPGAANGAMLYSEGWVTNTAATGWCADHYPSPCTPRSRDQGIEMAMWGAPGASGSPHIRLSNHRISVGPLSAGFRGDGGSYRKALSVRELMNWQSVDASMDVNFPSVNQSYIQSWGLSPINYFADLDGGHFYGGTYVPPNNVPNIQEDLEQIFGETQRDHYYFGFESERRNRMWTLDPDASFNPTTDNGYLNINTARSGFSVGVNAGLNLKPNTAYRLTLQTLTNSCTSQPCLSFGVQSGSSVTFPFSFNTVPGAGWTQQSFSFVTGATFDAIHLYVSSPVSMSVSVPSIIEEGSVMDFDTFDKRYWWRNDNTGTRAFIIPNGRQGGANWAGVVPRTITIPNGSDWPLRNRQLGLVGGQFYSICFWHSMRQGCIGSPPFATARLKSASQSGDASLATVDFSPGADWTQTCLPRVQVPDGDNMLQFGIQDQPGCLESRPAYYVDDIAITAG